MKKKVLLLLFVIVIMFSTVFAMPQKQAEAAAWGLAVPAGITIGAGGYALGALALAGAVGIVGYDENSEAINAHAMGVWEGGTQAAKDSLNYTIDMAAGSANALVSFEEPFMTYASSKINDFGYAIGNINSPVPAVLDDVFKSYAYNTGRALSINSHETSVYWRGAEIKSVTLTVNKYQQVYNIYTLDGKATAYGLNVSLADTALRESFESKMTQTVTAAGSVAIMNQLGIGITYGTGSGEVYTNSKAKMKEAWEGMRDAGLVLPVDSAVPLSSIDGTPLNYNADTDVYTGVDGGVYTGTPDWAFPQPKIRVANPDIAGSVPTTGVYVDTPVLTGNPTYDEAITGNPAIPHTTTNVQTGVTVGNPDIAVSEPIPGGGGTPEDGDSCARLKMPIFSPLKEQFSTSFPFSIPWDIGRAINAAFAEIGDEKPEFELDLAFMGETKKITITMPKMFDDWKPFSDSLLLFIFDVMIMFGIYRFVKGAGS